MPFYLLEHPSVSNTSRSTRTTVEQEEEEEEETAPTMDLAAPLLAAQEEPSPSAALSNDDTFTVTWMDHCVVWIGLPLLLFIQFSIALQQQQHQQEGQSAELFPTSSVNSSIVLFVIASHLFRRTLSETTSNDRCFFFSRKVRLGAFLLPEIIMDGILFVVLLGNVTLGYLVLAVATIVLSIVTIVHTTIRLWNDEGCSCWSLITAIGWRGANNDEQESSICEYKALGDDDEDCV